MMTGVMISSFYIFIKATQYSVKISNKIIIVVWCLLWAILYACANTGNFFIPFPIILPLACLLSIIFTFFLINQNLETTISAFLLSYGSSYFLRFIANFVVSVSYILSSERILLNMDQIEGMPLDYNQPIYILLYALVSFTQIFLAYLFFRIRRFKKGFPFIFHKFTIVAALFITGIILFFVTLINMLSRSKDHYTIPMAITITFFIASVLIAGSGIYILIRRLIKIFQRKKTQQNTDNYYENLLADKDVEIKRLHELVKARQAVVHNFAERINSIERNALHIGGESLEIIQTLKRDFKNELYKIKVKNPLQSTNIKAIDILFEHFAEEFISDDIAFNVIVDGSIKYMVDNVIEPGKLLTIISNHLKNAQIAVNAGNNPSRLVTAIIGLPNDCYEFTVLDSGIPFEPDTLMTLGQKYVTTHEDTGGSGIGLMTTFETMKEYGASLIINEKPPNEFDYTKSVTVRFDCKDRYIIETYRPDDIDKNDGQYTVVKI